MATSADQNGWIEWSGGECPVDPNALVRVWLRFETEDEAEQAHYVGRAWTWRWDVSANADQDGDIIAYRVVSTPERQS